VVEVAATDAVALLVAEQTIEFSSEIDTLKIRKMKKTNECVLLPEQWTR